MTNQQQGRGWGRNREGTRRPGREGGRESKMAESRGIFTHGTDFMNDLLIVDLMESGGSVK